MLTFVTFSLVRFILSAALTELMLYDNFC